MALSHILFGRTQDAERLDCEQCVRDAWERIWLVQKAATSSLGDGGILRAIVEFADLDGCVKACSELNLEFKPLVRMLELMDITLEYDGSS